MVEIENYLFSDDLFDNYFVCDLMSCKGGCCVEGDVGAPLTDEESLLVEKYFPEIKHLLDKKNIDVVTKTGYHEMDDEFDIVTPTIDGGVCAYAFKDELGIVKCGFERMYLEEKIPFRKPISCFLFPLRVQKVGERVIANYEPREGVCNAACKLGDELKVPVFRFLKTPIVQYYGEDIYEAMENVYEDYFNRS